MWVQMEQRTFWEREIRKRQQKLDAAEQELLSAKLSGLRDNVRAQEEAVRKARAAVKHGEEKHRNVRRWTRDYDHTIEPLARKLEGFRAILDTDLPKALSFLLQAQRTLESYADIAAPRSKPGPQPAAPPREEDMPTAEDGAGAEAGGSNDTNENE
jgi:hypothetical protein